MLQASALTSGSKHPHPPDLINDDETDDVSAKISRNSDENSSENETVLQWFDSTGKLASVSFLDNPNAFLFSRSHPDAQVCIKNDVDGCVWRPAFENEKRTWEHVATFDALAYVLGSKENKRFVSCAPDLKLAAVADCRHHVYIYRQPEKATLVNRKNPSSATVSRQHVIAIEPAEESVLGFQVCVSCCFYF